VVLSLAEAEALRGVIHIALTPGNPEPWLPGSPATFALRALGSRGALLDKTPTFQPGIQYQVPLPSIHPTDACLVNLK
jgi:hypothetical protein